MAETVVIPARFNGPPGTGNGGYTCGVVAGLVGGPAAISLRAPPPLDRELAVERDGDAVTVRDGETVVAEGGPAEVALEPPPAVGLEKARSASERGFERWSAGHPFPTCVVCGPDREPPDGFGVFPGRLDDSSVFAAPWIPDPSLAGPDGLVREECVWAALDCPTSAPLAHFGEGPAIVLARLEATLTGPVQPGEPHVLVSWPIAADGRKRRGAAALLAESGEPLALAKALWIELRTGSQV